MKKISFYTLGCKLNQAESAIMADQFREKGYEIVPFGDDADVCVINTCTVTAKTDYRCRQMIRRAKKIAPDAKIAVVGCYAQLHPEAIREINGVDFILGSDRKFDLVSLLENEAQLNEVVSDKSDNREFFAPASGYFWNHTRGFLKIQDGCDNFCSFCAVPLARGRSRSEKMEKIVAKAKKLVEAGHKEIVLTGVHIGMYGRDLSPGLHLLDVVKELESIEGLGRIRLSSLEPNDIDDDLLQYIAQSNKICHHFHVPLQSGDNEILRRMRRKYSREEYAEVIHKLHSYFPEAGLGTDVIVGFPGETEEHFENSVELIERLPFTYLHVFSYSVRPGTTAAKMAGKVNPKLIKIRSEKLRKIGLEKKKQFYRSNIGKKKRVLWETRISDKWMVGLTDEYVRVRCKFDSNLINQIGSVICENAMGDFIVGRVAESTGL